MALTDKEKISVLQAKIRSIEEFLATVYPSFFGDFIEATGRGIDSDTELSENTKQQVLADLEQKRNDKISKK